VKRLLFKKSIKSNEGFSLIELITVIGVFSIIGIIALTRFREVIKKAEKVVASNSISRIKIECESNKSMGRNLIFTPANLIGYEFDNEGSNKCTGNENFSLISIIPKNLRTQPSFFYDFTSGAISCNYEGSEAAEFPDCKKVPLSERKKQRCGDIGDWSEAQKFLHAGHSYLDRDNDGEACESLGRKSTKPEIGEITIKDCYDGDTCTSSEGEKIRLACIDTPEIRGKRAKPIEAIAARNFLNEMIKGKKVSIRRVTEDKYGRTVGELSFNGENLQRLLVNEGHAKIYKKYSKPCKWAS
tara:strand:+ start:249 stop:1145 length:897 start_codon:yes stop_codon:yes gene_type:complete